MPSSVKARTPRGIEIVFEEEPHVYYSDLPLVDKNGKSYKPVHVVYTSGTKFVHKFAAPFDPDGKITEGCARKRGISVEQLKFEWKQKSKDACDMGTRVHATCEDFFYNRPQRFQPLTEKEFRLMDAGIVAARNFRAKFKILGVEQLVGDVDIQLAGSIDLLAYDPATGTYWILDWKTNEKIERDNRYGAKMLEPIHYLPDCNAVHYGLQLSTYEMILRKGAYIAADAKVRRAIIHLTEAGPNFIELPDYGIQVRDMMIKELYTPPF